MQGQRQGQSQGAQGGQGGKENNLSYLSSLRAANVATPIRQAAAGPTPTPIKNTPMASPLEDISNTYNSESSLSVFRRRIEATRKSTSSWRDSIASTRSSLSSLGPENEQDPFDTSFDFTSGTPQSNRSRTSTITVTSRTSNVRSPSPFSGSEELLQSPLFARHSLGGYTTDSSLESSSLSKDQKNNRIQAKETNPKAREQGKLEGLRDNRGESFLSYSTSQILATRASAQRYIELTRKRLSDYVMVNREITRINAQEAIKNKDWNRIKKVLAFRISHLQEMLRAQKEDTDKLKKDWNAERIGLLNELRKLRGKNYIGTNILYEEEEEELEEDIEKNSSLNRLRDEAQGLLEIQLEANKRMQNELESLKFEHEQEIQQLKSEIKLQEKKEQASRKQLQEIKETTAKIEDLETEILILQQKLRSAEKECREIKNKYEAVKSAEDEKAKFAAVVEPLEEQRDTLVTELEEMESRFKNLNLELDNEKNQSTSTIVSLRQELETLKCEQIKGTENEDKLKEIIIDNEQQINELKKQVLDLESAFNAKSNENIELTNRVTELAKSSHVQEENQPNFDDLLADLEELRHEYEQLKFEFEDSLIEIECLDEEKQALEEAYQIVRDSAVELNKALLSITEELRLVYEEFVCQEEKNDEDEEEATMREFIEAISFSEDEEDSKKDERDV